MQICLIIDMLDFTQKLSNMKDMSMLSQNGFLHKKQSSYVLLLESQVKSKFATTHQCPMSKPYQFVRAFLSFKWSFHSAVNQSQQVPSIEHSNPLYFKSNTVFINLGGNTAGSENVSPNVVSATKKKK